LSIATRKGSVAVSKWVVGISLEEEVCWAASRVTDTCKFVCSSPEIHERLLGRSETENAGEFQNAVYEKLCGLRDDQKFADILAESVAVGVSTIGLVNRTTLKLVSVARKNWTGTKDKAGKGGCVVDFNELLNETLFPNLKKFERQGGGTQRAINIHNDATAKCLAEYYTQSDSDRVESLFYIMISEGVNGSLVIRGMPFATELHFELGHIWPKLHPSDYFFDPAHTGCPVHGECFEGVASGARIRKSWPGKTLRELADVRPHRSDHPCHIISYYAAQLCMIATLAVSPQRILVGGSEMFPALIPLIQKYFEFFNCGGRFSEDGRAQNYMQYDAMEGPPDFIQAAKIQRNDGIRGALELARMAAEHPRALGFVSPIAPLRT
jgi:predicted NBD/HSP70 family sugar kinase